MRKEQFRQSLRTMYDIQHMRVESYNRIVAIEQREDEDSDTRKARIEAMCDEYNRISEKVSDMRTIRQKKRFIKDNPFFESYLEYTIIEYYVSLKAEEERLQKAIADIIKNVPIYTEFLSKVKGCGPLMSAVIVCEFDIHTARHVSSFWKYAGLDVVKLADGTGVGRSKKKECLVETTYIDKNGKEATKMGISYNPFLKAKLIGVLGKSFVIHGDTYRKIYDDAKNRYKEAHPDYNLLHINNMAIRYAVKMFLKDLWNKWRELEGYPAEPDYWEKYISGRKHGENVYASPIVEPIITKKVHH